MGDRFLVRNALASLGLALCMYGGPAASQSRDFMTDECSRVGQSYFREFAARTDMSYNGQRVDGTHAVNGRIFLETRFEDFACSFDRSGQRMVEFFAEGRSQNAFLSGQTGSPQGSVVQVTGLRGGDLLNLRTGPGTTYAVAGQLSNGTSLRNLGCQMQGDTRWCQVELITDMRERGWVSGRYLTIAGSAPPPSSGPVVTVTGVAANDVLNVRAGPGTNHGIVGALGNGTQAREIGCEMHGSSQWCQIEMMTDMRERGWVNARFLNRGATAQPRPPAESATTRTVRVRFPSGSSGTVLRDNIGPSGSIRYQLNARNGQFLSVSVSGAGISYQILNPDGSILLDQVPAAQGYRGQLWQSGDHVIEVINRSNQDRIFTADIGIQ